MLRRDVLKALILTPLLKYLGLWKEPEPHKRTHYGVDMASGPDQSAVAVFQAGEDLKQGRLVHIVQDLKPGTAYHARVRYAAPGVRAGVDWSQWSPGQRVRVVDEDMELDEVLTVWSVGP